MHINVLIPKPWLLFKLKHNTCLIITCSRPTVSINMYRNSPPFPVAQAKTTQPTQAPHTVLWVVLYRSFTLWERWTYPLTSSYKPYTIKQARVAATIHINMFSTCDQTKTCMIIWEKSNKIKDQLSMPWTTSICTL